MSGLLTIGKVAAAAEMSAGAVRYYERLGLLPRAARTDAGYRLYPDTVVHRLTVIRGAQQFGFSLRDIASFFRVRDRGGAPCQAVRDAAGRMLAAVDAQLADLTARRANMAETLERWDERLVRTPPAERAHLLEMLEHPANPRGTSTHTNALRRGRRQRGR